MIITVHMYIEKYELPSLKIRSIRTITIKTFKIIKKQSPVYLHDLIQIKQNMHQNTAQ